MTGKAYSNMEDMADKAFWNLTEDYEHVIWLFDLETEIVEREMCNALFLEK